MINNQKARQLIQSWLDEEDDTEEQTKSLEQTMIDLDEDRLSCRKLFSNNKEVNNE